MTTTGRSLTAPFVHVWSRDPSLDREHPDFAALYAAFREDRDISKLPVRTGGELWIFECKPLCRQHHDAARSRHDGDPFGATSDAVRLGLKGWKGWSGGQDGRAGICPSPRFVGAVLAEECLDEMDYDLKDELGAEIVGAGRLRPTKGPASP
jgi:hypothetical protein